MNSKNEIKQANSMLYISFNQNNKFFSIGTEEGFLIYQTDPFNGPYERKMGGGIGIVEMIENSNFLVLMGGGEIPKYNKNKVVIWDDHENKVIAELKFISTILRVKYIKDYLIVVCQKRIYIFNFNTYEVFDTIDTSNNIKELIATNQTINPLIIAYPSPKEENKISIKNYSTRTMFAFKVQDDPTGKISMNNTGTLLASSNEHGTVIRIHSCSDGAFLQEFKRGIEKAKINSICFDNDTKFMAVSSSRGTIHIFSMGSTIKKLKEHEINKKIGEKNSNNDNKKDKKKKGKKEDKKEDNTNNDRKDKNNENKINDEKNENKIEDDKENAENKQNKIENDNTEGNKIEENKKDNENEINNNDIKINLSNDKKEAIKEEEKKEEDNINIKINNEEKKVEINKKDFKETPETPETPEEEELPQNSKTFLGSIFGSKIEKSFAQIRLKSQESICAFINSELLAIVTSDNKFYKYKIDTKSGGELKIFEEKNLALNKENN